MSGEEVKGEQLPIKVRLKVNIMNASIVYMDYNT